MLHWIMMKLGLRTEISCFCGGKFDYKTEVCRGCGMDLETCEMEFG